MYIGWDGREYEDAEREDAMRNDAEDLEHLTRQATFAYYLEIQALISKANRNQEYFELGGHDGTSPLYCLQKALQRALAEVRELRHHQHQWNNDDYCDICGRDGRV